MSFLCCCCARSDSPGFPEEAKGTKGSVQNAPLEIELPRAVKYEDRDYVCVEVVQPLVELSRRRDSPQVEYHFTKELEYRNSFQAQEVNQLKTPEGQDFVKEASYDEEPEPMSPSPVTERPQCELTPAELERQEFLMNRQKPFVSSLLRKINSLRKEADNGAKPLKTSSHMHFEASVIWKSLARVSDGFVVCGYNCCACTETGDVHGCLTYFVKQAAFRTSEEVESLVNAITTMWYENGNVNWYVNPKEVQRTTFDRDRKYFRDVMLNPLSQTIGFCVDLLPRKDVDNVETINELCLVVVFDMTLDEQK